MKEKGILKLIHENKERLMHYIFSGEKYQIIIPNNSPLYEEIKENSEISVITNIKEGILQSAIATIDENKETVKALFNLMLVENHTYFKEFDERLVKVDITLK